MMNEQLINDIVSLPFFEGKTIIHNNNSFAINIGVDGDTMLFLLANSDDENNTPSYSLYCSIRGVIKMDREADILTVIYEDNRDKATVEKKFKLSTYNLEKHKQSGTVLSYDIVTVLHAINEIIAFNVENNKRIK